MPARARCDLIRPRIRDRDGEVHPRVREAGNNLHVLHAPIEAKQQRFQISCKRMCQVAVFRQLPHESAPASGTSCESKHY